MSFGTSTGAAGLTLSRSTAREISDEASLALTDARDSMIERPGTQAQNVPAGMYRLQSPLLRATHLLAKP